MDLTKEQINELKENYGVTETVILDYLHGILNYLKLLNVNNVDETILYDCLVYCCDKDSSNEFMKDELNNKSYSNSDIDEEKYYSYVLSEEEIIVSAINEFFSDFIEYPEDIHFKK